MRIFRTYYKDKDGHKKQAKKWYIELRDQLDTVRRIPGFTDKRQSEALGRQIIKLVDGKVAGEKPDAELSRWLENIPARLRNNLVRIGLIDSQRAARQFCKWMVDDRRANESPVAHLKGLNTRTDRRHDRRALEPDELRRLLETTRNAPERFGMTDTGRAMLYRVAVETGLRANELRSLKVKSFNLTDCTVTTQVGHSKHRR